MFEIPEDGENKGDKKFMIHPKSVRKSLTDHLFAQISPPKFSKKQQSQAHSSINSRKIVATATVTVKKKSIF